MKLAASLVLAFALAARADEPAPLPEPNALDLLFASVTKDGAQELSEAARKQLIKVLPAQGRGQQCEKPAEVQETAAAIKDRGDGALVVAILSTCNGEVAYAFAPGTPVRIAKLFDVDEGRRLVDALSMNLRGGTGAEELGVVLSHAQGSELRFFARRAERGFAFAAAGTLPGFSSTQQCDESDKDHLAGWQSLLRVQEVRSLYRLRLDARCGGGLASVRCEVWHLDQGQLEKRGVCALPATFETEELRKAGWR